MRTGDGGCGEGGKVSVDKGRSEGEGGYVEGSVR